MTRQDFLDNQWRKYPALPNSDGTQVTWIYGKIRALNDSSLVLQDGSAFEPEALGDHALLGPSMPLALMALGDCVALEKSATGVRGPFLLSPNLGGTVAHLEKTAAIHDTWQIFLEQVRQFFVARDFRHWTTPYLVASSGVDAHIDFMTVQGVRTGRQFFLPTSPEFELKKALAAGEQRVFEIKSCFRDDDASPIHRVEFTMLEWYRSYENKWALVDDFEQLVAFLAPLFGFTENLRAERVSMAQLFEQHVGLALTPRTSRDELRVALESRGQHFTAADDWDDLFFRLFIECVEPHLGHDHPVVVCDFPAGQSSLAKQTPDGWADRFEIYWHGVELANAYQEQNNPYLVEKTIKREIDKRRQLDRLPHNMDTEFVAAMRAGLPPSAGAALGLNRLFMVLRSATSLV